MSLYINYALLYQTIKINYYYLILLLSKSCLKTRWGLNVKHNVIQFKIVCYSSSNENQDPYAECMTNVFILQKESTTENALQEKR